MVLRLSEADIAALAATMDTAGFATVENFVSPADLQTAQAFALQALAIAENGYALFQGNAPLSGTFLHTLAADRDFIALCNALCAHKTRAAPPADPAFYQIMRCITGNADKAHYLKFHYDSYVLTTLIPIAMPASGGDLVLVPNCRPLRRSYFGNLVDKVLADNPVTQMVLRMLYRARHGVVRRQPLKPGNLYLFWGYCTLHTNEPPARAEPRVTALIHCLNPHQDSGLRLALGRV